MVALGGLAEITPLFMRAHATAPAPGIVFKLVFADFADEILGSHHVDPTVLRSSGFTFSHPDPTTMAAWLTDAS